MLFRSSFLAKDRDLTTTVEVQRGGGRDAKGNPKPVEKLPVEECQVTPMDSSDPRLDRSDVTTDAALLYYTGPFRFTSTDRIVVPDGHELAGTWQLAGKPAPWQGTVELTLRRGT